jgi:acyl-CoA synthetase (AMP-forming)/AMP-acid ligase II
LWWGGEWQRVGAFVERVEAGAATWHSRGVRPGDDVAIIMANHPDYITHFYALLYLGARPALINPALREESLAHAISAANCVAAVCDPELAPHLARLPLVQGRWLASDIESSAPPIPPYRARLGQVAAHIFTSGTTGLPKAARVKQHRIWRAGWVFSGLIQFTSEDCIYCCLPLYHANASIIAVPSAILHRGRVALAPRFSPRTFWTDCAESEATTFIYVGELLRYLLNRATGCDEQRHQVTRILGNGLAPDLWAEVKKRFGIKRIAEYYAATEGNAETLNLFNLPGRMGPLLPWKMAVVAWDADADAPLRDARGRARWTRPGEPGLLVGRISARNEFAGYGDPRASKRKVLRGLLRDDDAWFNTGDLVSYDWLGHLRFVDRIGDTFRWKAENVSTAEVAAALATHATIEEATVYGVEIPGHEGRAGMAAVVLRDVGRFDGALDGLFAKQPRHAWPRFLRVVDALEVTGTFKQRKQTLRAEGWSEEVEDPLWLLDIAERRYRPLDAKRRAAVAAGSWKV